jgi:hypothetical protein
MARLNGVTVHDCEQVRQEALLIWLGRSAHTWQLRVAAEQTAEHPDSPGLKPSSTVRPGSNVSGVPKAAGQAGRPHARLPRRWPTSASAATRGFDRLPELVADVARGFLYAQLSEAESVDGRVGRKGCRACRLRSGAFGHRFSTSSEPASTRTPGTRRPVPRRRKMSAFRGYSNPHRVHGGRAQLRDQQARRSPSVTKSGCPSSGLRRLDRCGPTAVGPWRANGDRTGLSVRPGGSMRPAGVPARLRSSGRNGAVA